MRCINLTQAVWFLDALDTVRRKENLSRQGFIGLAGTQVSEQEAATFKELSMALGSHVDSAKYIAFADGHRQTRR